MTNKDINENVIKENWDGIWKAHNKSLFSFFEKLFYSIFKNQFSGISVYKQLEKIISETHTADNTFSIIECGCGSGLIQKLIFEKYKSYTSFLDISKEALKLTRSNLGDIADNKKIKFIEGSILSIPLPASSYDYVWNSGVLEHFNAEDQIKAVTEMYRITKPGGKVIIIIPSTYGKIYMRMKMRAERLGTWQAGYEKPLASMKELLPEFIKQDQYREFSSGFVSQLHYLKYIFKNKAIRNLSIPFLEIIQRMLFVFENKPGYFLIGIIDKK